MKYTGLESRSIPPVSREYLEALRLIFPTRTIEDSWTLQNIYRYLGQQDVLNRINLHATNGTQVLSDIKETAEERKEAEIIPTKEGFWKRLVRR